MSIVPAKVAQQCHGNLTSVAKEVSRGDFQSGVGARIRAARKAKNLTGDALASALHVARQTVSGWESGGALPDTAVLPALAVALGVSIDFLLGQSPAPTTPLPEADRLWAAIGRLESASSETVVHLRKLDVQVAETVDRLSLRIGRLEPDQESAPNIPLALSQRDPNASSP